MLNSELCVNLWFIVDIGTTLCYNWSIKAYNIQGDDETKLNILRYLSGTDFITAERQNLPVNLRTVLPDRTIERNIPISAINEQISNNLDFYIKHLEQTLPKVVSFSGDIQKENFAKNQILPDSPLFVSTVLMENEFGEIRPFTTEENQIWFQNERMRINNL